jgi:hypothetical protein
MRFLRIILKLVAAAVGLFCLLCSLVFFLGGAGIELTGVSVAFAGTAKYPQWSSLILVPAGLIPLLIGYLLFDLARDMYQVVKDNV